MDGCNSEDGGVLCLLLIILGSVSPHEELNGIRVDAVVLLEHGTICLLRYLNLIRLGTVVIPRNKRSICRLPRCLVGCS
jgi:hypothetical protein